jgi:hypothetical protein
LLLSLQVAIGFRLLLRGVFVHCFRRFVTHVFTFRLTVYH